LTRCEAFYRRVKEFLDAEDFEGLEKFCQKEAKSTLFRIIKYVEFSRDYLAPLPIGNVSECALRPLIQEGDPDIGFEEAPPK